MQLLVTTTNPHKLDEIRQVFAAEPDAAGLTWLDFAEVGRERGEPITEPVEDQPTFEGNARLKARHYAQQTGHICIADDSGLEVDALDGRPGVHSARYSTPPGQTPGPRAQVDPANNRKLLDELADVPADRRNARFVCAMAFHVPPSRLVDLPALAPRSPRFRTPGISPADPSATAPAPDADHGLTLTVRGTFEGRILLPHEADDPAAPHAGRGAQGFGYDPLFVLPDDHPHHPGLTSAQLTADQKNQLSHRGHAARQLLLTLRDLGLLGRPD